MKSRALVVAYTLDAASPNITSTYAVVSASLIGDARGVHVENTTGVPMALAYGPTGSEVLALQIAPNDSRDIDLILNKGMALSIKSLAGTVSAGLVQLSLFY